MICPVTNQNCRTNGCGEKCYKYNTLDSNHKLHYKYCKEDEINKINKVK